MARDLLLTDPDSSDVKERLLGETEDNEEDSEEDDDSPYVKPVGLVIVCELFLAIIVVITLKRLFTRTNGPHQSYYDALDVTALILAAFLAYAWPLKEWHE